MPLQLLRNCRGNANRRRQMRTARGCRGLAIADFWTDGRLSAVVNNLSDRPLLLVNRAMGPNLWLGLRLAGTGRADGEWARAGEDEPRGDGG